MECTREANLETCGCHNEGCERRGLCCQCLSAHLAKRQLPGCCFDEESSKAGDRGFDKFVELVQAGTI